MVGGDLELRGFYGNIMSICRLGNHEVSMETTRFPKKYASSRAGLRFPIGIHPSSCTWKLFIFRGNHVVSMEIS